MNEQLVKKTVRLPTSIVEVIATKPNQAEFMRQSIENQVELERKTKTNITIKVELANCNHYSHEFSVAFSLKGATSFREQISEFIDAIQNLQKAITRLDP